MADFVKAAETQLELHRWLLSEKGQLWLRQWIGGEKQVEPAKGDMCVKYPPVQDTLWSE